MSERIPGSKPWHWLVAGTLLIAGACGDDSAGSSGQDAAADGRDAAAGGESGADGSRQDGPVPADALGGQVDISSPRDALAEATDGASSPTDASTLDAPPSEPPSTDALRPEAASPEAPPVVDTSGIDGPANDTPGTEASSLDQSPDDGGVSVWQQFCPEFQVASGDAGTGGIIASPVLAATTRAYLPGDCHSCSPQVAADEAGLLYALAGLGQLSVSRDGGKSFTATADFSSPYYPTAAIQRIAAGRPGRLYVATTSAGDCTTLLASGDAGQSWFFARSVMAKQSELRLAALGSRLAVAGVSSGQGTLSVGEGETLSFDTVSFTTSGSWNVIADRGAESLVLVTVENDALVVRAWDQSQRALGSPTVTALPVGLTIFAMSKGLLVGASPRHANVYRVSLAAPQGVTTMAVPSGATIQAARGDAQGGFALIGYWDQPVANATNQSIRGYAAFHLPQAAVDLGSAWPIDMGRVATSDAYIASGAGADVVPLAADFAFAADAFGVARIGLGVAGEVLDWRTPPAAFP